MAYETWIAHVNGMHKAIPTRNLTQRQTYHFY